MKRRKVVGYLVDPSGQRLEVKNRRTAEAIRELANNSANLEQNLKEVLASASRYRNHLMKLQNHWWTRFGEFLHVIRPASP